MDLRLSYGTGEDQGLPASGRLMADIRDSLSGKFRVCRNNTVKSAKNKFLKT